MRELRSSLGAPHLYVYSSANQWLGLEYLARPDLPLEKVEPPQTLVLPRDSTAGVVLAIAANDAAAEPLDFVATDDESPVIGAAHALGFVDLPERTVKGPDGRVYFRFLRLPPASVPSAYAGVQRPESSLTLGNGLSVAGLSYPASLKAGDSATLTVLWEMPADPQASPWQDYVFFAHLVDRTGKTLAQKDWPVFQYRLLWRGGEYMVGQYELAVPADAGPGMFWLDLGAYEYYSRKADLWRDAAGKTLGEAYKTGPIVVAASQALSAPQQARKLAFGNVLTVEGYDLAQTTGAEGPKVEVALYWRAPIRPTSDYVVSVQSSGRRRPPGGSTRFAAGRR